MRQGSTPTHTFTLSIDPATIDKVRVLYGQDGKLVLRKEHEDCVLEENRVITSLNQEETLLFKPGKAEIQLRVNFKNGKSIPSMIYTVTVDRLLETEVFV